MDSVLRNVRLPNFGNVDISFRDIAEKIYKIYISVNEFERQKCIQHLGLISYAFEGVNHTRYEYVMLQCALADVHDYFQKGKNTALGSIKINGVEYSSNAVLKSWFLISNFGHLANTFGDEKSILLYCNERRGFRSHLLGQIKNEQLKHWAEKVIDDFHYTQFHFVLSVIRIQSALKKRLDDQNEIFNILGALIFPLDKIDYVPNLNKLNRLREVFQTIRSISIISNDLGYSFMPLKLETLSSLISFEFFDGDISRTKYQDFFNPLLSSLYDHVYLDVRAQTLQRSYEIASIRELKNREYKDIVKSCLNTGLTDRKTNLNHFLRLKIHSRYVSNHLFHELRRTHTVKRQCPNVESSVDLNKISEVLVYDFFTNDKFDVSELPQFLFNIFEIVKQLILDSFDSHPLGKQLSALADKGASLGIPTPVLKELVDHFRENFHETLLKDFKELFFPTYESIVWSIIRFCIKSKYTIIQDKGVNEVSTIGVDFHEEPLKLLQKTLLQEIQVCDKVDRQHELKMLSQLSKREFKGYKLAMISRIKIYDYSKEPSKRLITDIDSVLIKISSSELIVELCEAKNCPKPEKVARKDIKEKLYPTLSFKSKQVTISDVKGFGAKVRVRISS